MIPEEHRRPAGDQGGDTANILTTIVTSACDAERARRQLRLHHQLVRRRRWSNELDEVLEVDDFGEDLDDALAGDYWGDVTYMSLGIPERRRAGMTLARRYA